MSNGNNQDGGDTRECETMRKIFVGGIHKTNTTDDSLKSFFSQYGEICDHIVMKDRDTRESRGFAFVTFQESASVEKVFQSRPVMLDGKEVECKRAMPKELNATSAHSKTTRLFVGGIRDSTPEDLKEYIESRHPTEFGTCTIDFLKDRDTGKYKGYGFIECSSNDFADRLVICEQQFSLPNSPRVNINKAQAKDGGSGGGGRGGSGRGRGGDRGGRGGYQGRGGYGGNQQTFGSNQGGGYGGYGGGNQGYANVAYPGQQSGAYGPGNGYQQQSGGYGSSGYGSSGYGSGQPGSGWGGY